MQMSPSGLDGFRYLSSRSRNPDIKTATFVDWSLPIKKYRACIVPRAFDEHDLYLSQDDKCYWISNSTLMFVRYLH